MQKKGGVRDQKGGKIRHLPRRREATERVTPCEFLHRRVRHFQHSRSRHIAWPDRIHPNVPVGIFERGAAGKADDAMLARGIGG